MLHIALHFVTAILYYDKNQVCQSTHCCKSVLIKSKFLSVNITIIINVNNDV